MGKFELTELAEVDLQAVYSFGLDQFGVAQALRYQDELFGCMQLLADYPGIAGRPFKVKKRDVFRFPFGSHVIVFTTTQSGIAVRRIFHESSDWRRLVRRHGV